MSTVDVAQFRQNFHVPKEAFRELITLYDLSFVDLKVICYLLTVLSGYNKTRRINTTNPGPDPNNFTKIHIDLMSEELGIKVKKIKKSIKYLTEIQVLEKGNGAAVKGGYRFTF